MAEKRIQSISVNREFSGNVTVCSSMQYLKSSTTYFTEDGKATETTFELLNAPSVLTNLYSFPL